MLQRKWSILILFAILIPVLFTSTAYAQDDSGIAISGSFYSYDYHILQGGTIDTPAVNIVLINNNINEIRIKLDVVSPDGISIETEKGLVSIKPNEKITIPVSISANSSIDPGKYDIAITCQQQKVKVTDALNVSSIVSLDTTITVHQDAGFINLLTTNMVGETITSEVFINRINENGSVSPALHSTDGIISANIPSGEYEINAFIDDKLVNMSTISLANSQNITQNIQADLIDINNIEVKKAFDNASTNSYLQSVELSYTMSNMQTTINDCRLSLVVKKDDELLEIIDMFRINELIPGKGDFSYVYAPYDRWDNADYKLQIEVYKDYYDSSGSVITNSQLIDKSNIIDINVVNANTLDKFLEESIPYAIIAILVLGIMILIIAIHRRVIDKDNFIPMTTEEFLNDLFLQNDNYRLLNEAENGKKNIEENINQDEDITLNEQENSEEIDDKYNLTKDELIEIALNYYSSLPKAYLCPACKGTGATLYNGITEECVYCNGIGKVMNGMTINPDVLSECVKCQGTGIIDEDKYDEVCTFCNGYKKTVTSKGAIYIDKRKLKIHNITYDTVKNDVEKFIIKNGDIISYDI